MPALWEMILSVLVIGWIWNYTLVSLWRQIKQCPSIVLHRRWSILCNCTHPTINYQMQAGKKWKCRFAVRTDWWKGVCGLRWYGPGMLQGRVGRILVRSHKVWAPAHLVRWKAERLVDPRGVQRCMLWLRELSCPSRWLAAQVMHAVIGRPEKPSSEAKYGEQ